MVNNFVPNGLLSNETNFVAKVLKINKWDEVEQRTMELLKYILPNQKSEAFRHNVISYIKGLITTCIPCKVLEFGSVPLRTYLPDGDIDLTIFGQNEFFPEELIPDILHILENEKENENAQFKIKEVHFVQAEVKVIKCLVDNIVVDISFNQLSGLCSLCFLEEVDNLISRNHLFKCSILLVKAWCYHESRLLGSSSGLFSTYALEILVVYIFNLYNNDVAGPLEVLFRFLEFLSKFDWDHYCISLDGPVAKRSLPNMIAEPPRKGFQSQGLLLTEQFLSACKSCYGNMPRSQENQEGHFVSKHINIIDPLRSNNNLGRSINRGNFSRIKSAIKLGAQRMASLLDCTDGYLIAEFDHFFKNTWNRHGNVQWIPISIYNQNKRNKFFGKPTCQETDDQQAQASSESQSIYQKPDKHLKESKRMLGTSDACSVYHTLSSRTDGMLSCDRKHTNSMTNALTGKGKSPQCSSSEVHAMHHFASNRCSVESAPIYSEAQTQHCNASVSERKSGLIRSSSMTDNSIDEAMRQQKEEHPFEKDIVEPVASNVMNPVESSKCAPALESTSGANLSSLPPKTTLIDDVSTVSMDNFERESTAAKTVALNFHALPSPCASGSSVLQFPVTYNNCPIGNETSNMNVESSVSLYSNLQHKFAYVSHDNSINQFEDLQNLYQSFDILKGDYKSYWINLQHGRYCQNRRIEEHLRHPPLVPLVPGMPTLSEPLLYPPPVAPLVPGMPTFAELLLYPPPVAPLVPGMPTLADSLLYPPPVVPLVPRMRTLADSLLYPPPVVPFVPRMRTLASNLHEGNNQSVSFWLPRLSDGTGTFMPNSHNYVQSHHDRDLYNRHQNNFYSSGRFPRDGQSQRQGQHPRNMNSNSRERFSSRDQNRFRTIKKPGEEGSSSAVNELANSERDSKDASPHHSS